MMLRRAFLLTYQMLYRLIRTYIFWRYSAQAAHERMIDLLRYFDRRDAIQPIFRVIHRMAFAKQSVAIGGVDLPYPVMLAAGFVKGEGFQSEEEALAAVERGENIIPGWRTMPALVGIVEIGSFTRFPRMGNPGVVMWRGTKTRSTQNRVGLKNPGAKAAASFFQKRGFPANCGINIAVSPGMATVEDEQRELLESLAFFLEKRVYPAWFTLNLSCPNTEDDPQGNQTEEKARLLCGSVIEMLRPYNIPLWVKIGPDLAREQITTLAAVFHQVGVKAVIATNTLAKPAPNDANVMAGAAGGQLFPHAIQTARSFITEILQNQYDIDVIGCGGAQNRTSYCAYLANRVAGVQYWSGLVYAGPLVGAVMYHKNHEPLNNNYFYEENE